MPDKLSYEELEQKVQSLQNECAALGRAEEQFRLLLQNMNDAVYVHEIFGEFHGRIIEVNDRACEMLGYTRAELLKMNVATLDIPEYRTRIPQIREEILQNRHVIFDTEHLAKNGMRIPVEVSGRLFDFRGTPCVLTIVRDMSERNLAQARNMRQQHLNQMLLDSFPCVALLMRPHTREIIAMNKAAAAAGCVLGRTCFETWAKSEKHCRWCLAPKLWDSGKEQHLEVGALGILWDAHWIHVSEDLYLHYAFDITERKLAEKELKRQQNLLETTERISKIGGWEYDAVTQKVSWTTGVYEIHGVSKSEYDPVNVEDDIEFYHPEDRPILALAFRDAVQKGELYDLELRLNSRDGQTKWVRTTCHVEKGGNQVVRLFGNIWDITARKQAEAEREKLQVQLLQAQKMESVGRLAGGVAHDYNNMLSVILGCAEMALSRVSPEDPLHIELTEIYEAARHSADITRQLLAYARKQTISPKIIDLNALVESMLKMLRRLLGEAIDLRWHPGKQVWHVEMDPMQVEQMLANLCSNAKDAIAGIGNVTIETENAMFDEEYCKTHTGFISGGYVLLAVSDNGRGMDSEVLKNVFEPFFSTKGLAEGTGLGLPTVYGIVRQNNGFINIATELGKGTTFQIYLPRYASSPPQDENEKGELFPKQHPTTVLLVEDEPAILRMGEGMLRRLGYRVLTAATPIQALDLAKTSREDIDLLISDVVMPGMNGMELAKKLSAICPDMKTLFMSGYAADVIADHGVLEKDQHFLPKPFALRELEAKVRMILGR